MDQKQKSLKIAEECGIYVAIIGNLNQPNSHRPECQCNLCIPDYFNDLNACAEMRKALTVSERGIFGDCLARMRQTKDIELEKHFQLRDADDDALFAPNGDGWFAIIDFTAAECAEAFGRVKGLW